MIARNQLITLADLQALAFLASSKTGNTYDFSLFAGKDQVELPKDLSPVATYGGAGQWPDGFKITVRLYGYKTIAGAKTYTYIPLLKAFQATAGAGVFSMTWTWVSVTGATKPDGYIIAIPMQFASGWQYDWIDVGNVETFTEDGSFSNPGWKVDQTLDAANSGNPTGNFHCGHGTWLKTLNNIHQDAISKLDIYGGGTAFGDAHKVSGPWCVSVAPKCYLTLLNKPALKNLKFIYSEADSMTGNQLASEADMLGVYIGVKNGGNSFNWDVPVTINGIIRIFSTPANQLPANWTLAASDPSITINLNPFYVDIDAPGGPRTVTAFEFTFTDTPYVVGTPIVLTCTPTAGGNVIDNGNPFGSGGRVDVVFTGAKSILTKTDTFAIHVAGVAAKSVALSSAPAAITLTTPTGGTNAQESHWRSFCNGVFVANTLPTLGLMTYLDQDLPQYNLSGDSSNPPIPSSRRAVISDTLPPISAVDNRGALYPVFRDTDFTVPLTNGRTKTGGKAWQESIFTKYAVILNHSQSAGTNDFSIPRSIFIPTGTADARFYTDNTGLTLYIKKGAFPTLADFDAREVGGTWLSLAASVPGFNSADDSWFYAVYNPTAGTLTTTTTQILVETNDAPSGTFFPTLKDDDGVAIPIKESFSYHLSDPTTFDARPIPMFGYTIYSICIRRLPEDNGSGVAIAPSVGTSDLSVQIGCMAGFGFDTAGTFQSIQTITIPAGQASITTEVLIPVLAGAPLAYQSTETVFIRAQVNFQPIIHSTFAPVTSKLNGVDTTIGYYNGPLWYQMERALLFFKDDITQAIVLPLTSDIYNDLTNLLNTF